MTLNEDKIALGGGCHWCTEAVFQSLLGVLKVEQGYVASIGDNGSFSEAVIVFLIRMISLQTLIEIHLQPIKVAQIILCELNTDRQFIRFLNQRQEVVQIIETLQKLEKKLITQVFPFQTLQLQEQK
jgi:peptide-methionine (S)-S-oxide reductase